MMKRTILHVSKSYSRWHLAKSDNFKTQIRLFSTRDDTERRSHLFSMEKRRQFEEVGRIEKIDVRYLGVPQDTTLIMNKDISTPFDCAQHLGELHKDRSALALLDGNVYWDIHRPLTDSCTLELQHFTIKDPQQVNRAFWRTCSFVLGACASFAFKDRVNVKLHSFPGPDVRSGSFVYDIDLDGLPDWIPTKQELYCMSAEYIKLAAKSLPLERLDVSKELALEMFKDNEYKTSQIPNISQKNDGNVTVYRMGQHVDISRGPMVGHSGLIGKATITAVHQILAPDNQHPSKLYRFQGVALPKSIIVNYFVYSSIIEARAKQLNPARSPFEIFYQSNDSPEKHEITA